MTQSSLNFKPRNEETGEKEIKNNNVIVREAQDIINDEAFDWYATSEHKGFDTEA